MPADRHPGITMHKLSFDGGFIGLVFAAGSALIFVLGFPTLWYFVAFAFGLGVLIAVLLRGTAQRMSERNKPLSIMSVSDRQPAFEAKKTKKLESRQIVPQLASA